MWVGILLSVSLLIFGNLQPGKPQVTRAAAVAVLMACWWIGEALPLAVTALLPLVLFPLLGVMNSKAVASQYLDDNVFLFVGGFIIALAMERWHLHKRIALRILLLFGTQPRRILLGFMVATGFVSMWISNTAATMMMVPIALAILVKLEETEGKEAVRGLSVAVLLGVAYSASIGGIATLVGTPTNLTLGTNLLKRFPDAPPVTFTTWLLLGLPLAGAMLLAAWAVLAYRFVPKAHRLTTERDLLRREYAALGPMSFAEKVVLADFCVLVLLWLTRATVTIGGLQLYGWTELLPKELVNDRRVPFVQDGSVSIAAAVALFLIPARPGSRETVMNWPTAVKLPWDVVLLFGGGFALAGGFAESGLSEWLGNRLAAAGTLPPLVILTIICLLVTFLTELTSNTATSQTLLPITAALSVECGLNPLFLMVPVTIASSLGFMMPAGTPPNAIVFGTRRVSIPQMATTGLVLNLVGVVLLVLAMYTLGLAAWGIDLDELPDWASPNATK